jgi:hypothetical protein
MTEFRKKMASTCLHALYLMVAAGLTVSPFLFEFDVSTAAIRNQVILGVLFGIFALWSMLTEKQERAPFRNRAN